MYFCRAIVLALPVYACESSVSEANRLGNNRKGFTSVVAKAIGMRKGFALMRRVTTGKEQVRVRI